MTHETTAGVRVRDVMAAPPVTAAPDEPLQDVIGRMMAQQVGAVLVVTGGTVAGIFTERDFLRVAAEAPHGWRQRSVADWMTPDPTTIGPDVDWETAVSLLEGLKARHLPVVERGRPIGVVSARQLISHRTAHLDRLVQERTAELQRATEMVRQRERQAQRDMRVADRLLSRLLVPGRPPAWPDLSWAVHCRPLGSVGGDYYDFECPTDRLLGVLIADASGHSVAAALVAVMARIAFDEAVRVARRPTDVLGVMNERLQGIADERYVTALYGVFDRTERTFTFSNAGHPVPLHYDAQSGACHPIDATGFMLGIVPEAIYQEWTIMLAPGDLVLLASDGVTDCRDPNGEMFGVERLVAAVNDVAPLGAGEVMRHTLARLADHRGTATAPDDETLLIAEVREGAGR